MASRAFTLEDRYAPESRRLFLTGPETLTRALLSRAWLDRREGRRTGGLVSGYRGSPLGSFDQTLARAQTALTEAGIHVQPGLNEELAATQLWGSQQLGLFPQARVDGVFGLWYGKGPGVDRAGDALKHANLAGTSPLGGVLAVAGDDHGAVSSTTAHQSEFAFIDAQIPILAPADLQDVFDFGVAGLDASRHAGCWFALVCPAEIIERAETVDAGLDRLAGHAQPSFPQPGDLHIRWPDRALDQARRLTGPRLDAARAFIRARALDRILDPARDRGAPAARIGLVASGKAWGDLAEALAMLGLDAAAQARAGLRLFKPACVWPLDRETVRTFAEGLEEILVVEEMRPLVEPQFRDLLYDLPGPRPMITGKADAAGEPLIPPVGIIGPTLVARALAQRLAARGIAIPAPLASPADPGKVLTAKRPTLRRLPHFCPGCPHSRSTRLPEGAQGLAGIGCHTMALWNDPQTRTLTQMGGEGATWIGRAPFTLEADEQGGDGSGAGGGAGHVFVNMGDGTFAHSGSLAIRAAIAARITVTFKILVNDAVAMTGGQRVDGGMSVPAMARALAAEGVSALRVVAEDPAAYPSNDPFPPGVAPVGRERFAAVQKDLAETRGVSVLIFDQACAAEKRRRRKRGTLAAPERYVVINERVCEGCGDCQLRSNCLAVVPVQTPLGDKRQIETAACNADESCLEGFCPAMVTIEGGRPRAAARPTLPSLPAPAETLPDPAMAERPQGASLRMVIAGIGGTGVVTLAHVLGQAATFDGQMATVLDQTGLAQKGGAVACHVTLAGDRTESASRNGGYPVRGITARIPDGQADLLIACDVVAAADPERLALLARGRSRVVANTTRVQTARELKAQGPRATDEKSPTLACLEALEQATGADAMILAEADPLSRALTGEPLTANMLLLGLAWQRGLVPLAADAIHRAILLNGALVDANRAAFDWGRWLACDRDRVLRIAGLAPHGTGPETPTPTPQDAIDLRRQWLAAYGEPRNLDAFERALARTAAREQAAGIEGGIATLAVAEGYFRVLARKDAYEVARLFTDGAFEQDLLRRFEGPCRIHYHMVIPGMGGIDPETGRPAKRRLGPWFRPLLALLARIRMLRGTLLDPFRWQAGHRLEKVERKAYEDDLELILQQLAPNTLDACVALARLPLEIRGYGPVREDHRRRTAPRRAALLEEIARPDLPSAAAE